MTQDQDAAAQKLPPGRHGLPRQFVLHNQRARLVDAATEVFGSRSYAEARVADVLERAAISRKTFYEQFSDKEDCFLAAYDAAASRAAEFVSSAARNERDRATQLRAGLEALLRFLADQPELARLLVIEVGGAGPAARRRRDEVIERFSGLLQQRGGSRDVTTELIVGGLWQVVHTRLINDRAKELPGLAKPIADSALALLDSDDGTHAQTA